MRMPFLSRTDLSTTASIEFENQAAKDEARSAATTASRHRSAPIVVVAVSGHETCAPVFQPVVGVHEGSDRQTIVRARSSGNRKKSITVRATSRVRSRTASAVTGFRERMSRSKNMRKVGVFFSTTKVISPRKSEAAYTLLKVAVMSSGTHAMPPSRKR